VRLPTSLVAVTPCAVITALGRCQMMRPSGGSRLPIAIHRAPCSRGAPPVWPTGSDRTCRATPRTGERNNARDYSGRLPGCRTTVGTQCGPANVVGARSSSTPVVGYRCMRSAATPAATPSMAQARARHAGRPQPVSCVACGKPFQPKRSDALTCSHACRQQAYRERQHRQAADPPRQRL
jgi:hypothetical protein